MSLLYQFWMQADSDTYPARIAHIKEIPVKGPWCRCNGEDISPSLGDFGNYLSRLGIKIQMTMKIDQTNPAACKKSLISRRPRFATSR